MHKTSALLKRGPKAQELEATVSGSNPVYYDDTRKPDASRRLRRAIRRRRGT